MNLRLKAVLLFLVPVSILSVSPSYTQDKFKLKPGAKGKICVACHTDFAEKMKLPFVHSPVKSGDCSSCHNPHTSGHGKLTALGANKICISCHDGILPSKPQSVHQAAADGNCMTCHDPHASNNKFNLRSSGNELCYSCHKGVSEAVKKYRFKHGPVGTDCLNCHNPHASTRSAFLLKNPVPSLCIDCHKTSNPAFARQHQAYPVAKSRCTSCHDPHGSNRGGLFWGNVHRPVANKMCNQCHFEASSTNALKVRKTGYELCRGCHNSMLNDTFGKTRVHWPLLGKEGCLTCHNPHSSKWDGLMKEQVKLVCGACHADSMARQEKSVAKHKPVEEGKCSSCHSPHSSNNVFLLDNASTIDLCGTCHDWQRHKSHPIGAKIVDPRNRNLSLDCLSCHRSHGTDKKLFAYFDPKMDLCVQCHVKFTR